MTRAHYGPAAQDLHLPCPQNHTFGRQKSSFWRMRRRLQRGFVPPVVQERSTEGHTKKEVGVEEVDLISSAFGDARLDRHAGRSAGYAGGRAGSRERRS